MESEQFDNKNRNGVQEISSVSKSLSTEAVVLVQR
jgi:hypothetical protein